MKKIISRLISKRHMEFYLPREQTLIQGTSVQEIGCFDLARKLVGRGGEGNFLRILVVVPIRVGRLELKYTQGNGDTCRDVSLTGK